MSQREPVIRNVSDTARWAAVYRARETDKKDALFRDPFARRLAGARGEQIAAELPFGTRHAWSWIVRTYLFDQFITGQVQQGVDMVVNLAAGLDARPYRMALPASLKWIEVDLPDLLSYKEEILAREKPVCALERVRLNLSNVSARRQLFAQLGSRADKALIITEGLLIYLTRDEVGTLAEDLETPPTFRHWVLDLASPALLHLLWKNMGSALNQGGALFKFGPEEGPEFFTRFGWKPVDVRSMIKTAAHLKRLPLRMRFFALLPEPNPPGSGSWSGVCLLGKQFGIGDSI